MYLGIDVGTSGVKVILTNDGNNIIASETSHLKVIRSKNGWSEQDPSDWWEATNKAVYKIKSHYSKQLKKVQGVGLSGQMHGLTALDKSDKPLRHSILWNDTRSSEEAKFLDDTEPLFRSIGGNVVMPGFTAPKALWLKKNELDVFNQIETILLPKDYIRLLMTGEKCSDMSDSSGTLWLDIAKRKWSDKLLNATDLSIKKMPTVIEGSQNSGYLRSTIASQWGIEGSPLVAGGGGDNASTACGLGVIEKGDAFISLGTSGVIFLVSDKFIPAANDGAHSFCHAIQNKWHLMSVILSATDSLNWLSEIFGKKVSNIMETIGDINDGPSDLMFHPYLSGERTPHNDANARGSFMNISRSTTSKDLARAVVEGVSYAFADCIKVFENANLKPKTLIAAGGGSQSDRWLEIISTVINTPIEIPNNSEHSAALGAARLGMLAFENENDTKTILVKPKIKKTINPKTEKFEEYQEKINHWRELYSRIKDKK